MEITGGKKNTGREDGQQSQKLSKGQTEDILEEVTEHIKT